MNENVQRLETLEELGNQVFDGLVERVTGGADPSAPTLDNFASTLSGAAVVFADLNEFARVVTDAVLRNQNLPSLLSNPANEAAFSRLQNNLGNLGLAIEGGLDIGNLIQAMRDDDFGRVTDQLNLIGIKIIFGSIFLVGAGVAGIAVTPIVAFATGYTLGGQIYENRQLIGEGFADFGQFVGDLFDQFTGALENLLLDGFNGAIDFLIDAFELALERYDPLVIDLDGDGVNTTNVDGSSVTFDVNNDGTEETVGWFEAEDGILFHDWKSITGDVDADGNPIGDGEAQDRSELFATFEELSRHDLNGDGILDARDVAPAPTEDINGDGVIDEQDAQSVTLTGDFDGDGELETIQIGWDQIQVWRDANQNGNVDDGELFSLEELGIESIDLNAEEREIEDNGNLINSESTVTFADGTTRIINGVDLSRDTVNQSYEQKTANLDLSLLPLAA